MKFEMELIWSCELAHDVSYRVVEVWPELVIKLLLVL